MRAWGYYTGTILVSERYADTACVARCRVIVDEPGAKASCGDLATPLASGAISAAQNDLSTLGELLLQSQAGESAWVAAAGGNVDCTLFKSVGVAVQDVATAAAAVASATKLGLGVKATL